MRYKKNGFIYIECIVSLFILSTAIYIISTSLYNSYIITNSNEENINMLNIAKTQLGQEKYDIESSEVEITQNYYKEEIMGDYVIYKTIEKDRNYYRCYEVNVEVKKDDKSIKLNSYVTQK